jgi:hypothetical protein
VSLRGARSGCGAERSRSKQSPSNLGIASDKNRPRNDNDKTLHVMAGNADWGTNLACVLPKTETWGMLGATIVGLVPVISSRYPEHVISTSEVCDEKSRHAQRFLVSKKPPPRNDSSGSTTYRRAVCAKRLEMTLGRKS